MNHGTSLSPGGLRGNETVILRVFTLQKSIQKLQDEKRPSSFQEDRLIQRVFTLQPSALKNVGRRRLMTRNEVIVR